MVGIGETGLDYYYDNSPHDVQKESFRIISAQPGDRLADRDNRDADEDMADILEDEMGKGAFPGVLHCFSSGADLARRGRSVSISRCPVS